MLLSDSPYRANANTDQEYNTAGRDGTNARPTGDAWLLGTLGSACFPSKFFARIGFGKRGGLHDKNEAVWFCSSSADSAFDASAGGANSSIFGFTPRDNYNATCPPVTLLAAGRHLAVRNTAAQTN